MSIFFEKAMNRLNLPFIILVSLFLFSGCEQQTAIQPSGTTVNIGFVGPFSGPDDAQGEESLKGVKTIMQLQPLLHNGDAIELVIENDNNDPKLTAKALRKLIAEDKVAAILLASGSHAALKAVSVADTGKTPVIALLATHPDVIANREFVSQLCLDDKFQGSVAALFVADELLIEKVAVFTDPSSAYSIYLGAEFMRKYEHVGGEITEVVSLGNHQADYAQIMEDLQQQGAELLYFPLEAKYVMEIVKAANQIGWSVEMMGSDGLLASVINKYPEDVSYLDGIYATDFFGTVKDADSSNDFAKRARKAYYSLFHGTPSSYTALGAEGYAVLHNAMDRCEESADQICINRKIRSTRKIQGFMSKISIRADGKAERPLFVNKIRNGVLESVVKVY